MCMDVCTCVCNIQYIQIFTVIVIKFTLKSIDGDKIELIVHVNSVKIIDI